ncbi:MAG: exopolyphosphatase [Endozoicomonadaceae bacterium]|nr:exopolyphosphatase [Endozoicomonadaceae bacterium]
MITPDVTDAESLPLVVAIDLGSNSFHMLLARQDHNEIRPVKHLSKKVQLSTGLDERCLLTDEAMELGLSCLREFAEYIDGMASSNIRIVGTSALRKARNSDIFVRLAEQELGHRVDILAGREEARLIYLGLVQTCFDDGERRLVVDIGGGSTEFIIGQRFESCLLESLHMGCVTYTRQYFPHGSLSNQHFRKAYYSARREMMSIEKAYRSEGWVNVIGSSGSVKSVHNILGERGFDRITLDGLKQLKSDVLTFQNVEEVKFPGLKSERVALFPAGLAILMAIFDSLEIDAMDYSAGALREGVLYDLVGRQSHEDVRERTIHALMTRHHADEERARRVSKQVEPLFKQVADDWKLIEADCRLLQDAALLHEIGMNISDVQFHRHGAYIIQNSDLFGFSRYEQQQLAILVRGHRRTLPLQLLCQLPEMKFTQQLRLMILLRLTILLSQIRTDRFPDVKLQVKERQMKLIFSEGWLDKRPLVKASFEHEREYLERTDYRLTYI